MGTGPYRARAGRQSHDWLPVIWAISDLHLSFTTSKPMDIFGPHWEKHHLKIASAWREMVSDEDAVLVAGDISWAMKLDEADADLRWLGDLPGRKIILRGNHDYWWTSISQVRSARPDGVQAIQNDYVELPDAVVVGTRGWTVPESPMYDRERDERVYERELQRLRLSLEAARKAPGLRAGKPLLAMMHFPPVIEGRPTAMSEILASAGVDLCVYGHLHLQDEWPANLDCELDGVTYMLVSADYIDFRPVPVDLPLGRSGGQ